MTARRFGPVEIIDAGTRDSRETFAWLYVELDRVRAASAWVWHRAFVDPAVPLLDGVERLPCHPPAPGFGGQDLARRPVPIAVDRLTDAGLMLYAVGVSLAAAERSALERALVAAIAELEALRAVPDRATRQRWASLAIRRDPGRNAFPPGLPETLVPWPDVPVRIPGTDRLLPPRGDAASTEGRGVCDRQPQPLARSPQPGASGVSCPVACGRGAAVEASEAGGADMAMVIVPDLIGQPVHVAREIAAAAGLGLASGDPDGPGLGSRTWPGLFWVTTQDPPAGSTVESSEQVRITFVEDGEARADVPTHATGPIPTLTSHAEPDSDAEKRG